MPLLQNKGMTGFCSSEDLWEISSSFIARLLSKIVWVCLVGTSAALLGGFTVATHYIGLWFSLYCLEQSASDTNREVESKDRKMSLNFSFNISGFHAGVWLFPRKSA